MRTLTQNEIQSIKDLDTRYYLVYDFYRKLFEDWKNPANIQYSPKQQGENKGQYGYYISRAGYLIFILKELKINSLLDLGSGSGVLLWIIQRELYNIKLHGYEIEDSLIQIAEKLLLKGVTEKKDILTLTKEDISKYKALYFWEPLYDNKLAKKFVDNLTKIISKEQIIIYQCSGHILDHLKKTNKYNIEQLSYLYIITLK